jgi:hypothetical protein
MSVQTEILFGVLEVKNTLDALEKKVCESIVHTGWSKQQKAISCRIGKKCLYRITVAANNAYLESDSLVFCGSPDPCPGQLKVKVVIFDDNPLLLSLDTPKKQKLMSTTSGPPQQSLSL